MPLVRDLIPPVLQGVPEAAEPIVERAYLDAARDFCRETRAWHTQFARFQVAQQMLGPELTELQILPGQIDTEVFDARWVRYRDNRLEKGALEGVGRGSGAPHRYQTRPGILVLDAPEVDPESMSGSFCLRPIRNAREIEDEAVAEWAEIFEHGAYARLLTAPNQPWANPQLGGYYLGLFIESIALWKSRGADGGQVGVVREVAYGGY